MGTRHLILVYYKGQYRIAQYGQWDGFPSGQGCKILTFIRDTENIEKLKSVLDDPDMLYKPSPVELSRILRGLRKAFSDHMRGSYTKDANPEENLAYAAAKLAKDLAPSVSRETGGEILQVVANATKPLPLENSIDFLADKLMCEWVYVIDLDKATFEVYSSREAEGMRDIGRPGQYRFDKNIEGLEDAEYFPPMVGEWSLDALPDDARFVESIGYGS